MNQEKIQRRGEKLARKIAAFRLMPLYVMMENILEQVNATDEFLIRHGHTASNELERLGHIRSSFEEIECVEKSVQDFLSHLNNYFSVGADNLAENELRFLEQLWIRKNLSVSWNLAIDSLKLRFGKRKTDTEER